MKTADKKTSEELNKKAEEAIKKANQTCFITVTELAKYKVSVYVSENSIMIRDNVDMSNSMLIPLDELILNRGKDNTGNQETNTDSSATDEA